MMGGGSGAGRGVDSGVSTGIGGGVDTEVGDGAEDEHYIQLNNQRRRWMWFERSWVRSGVGGVYRF